MSVADAPAPQDAASSPAPFGECRVILVPADHERSRRFYADAVGLEVMAVFDDDTGMLLRLNAGRRSSCCAYRSGRRRPASGRVGSPLARGMSGWSGCGEQG